MRHSPSDIWTMLSAVAAVGICTCFSVAHPGPGIVVDRQERVYFVDFTHDRVMRVSPDGTVAVFADGQEGKRFSVPHHLVVDKDNVLVASDREGKVWRLTPQGAATQMYPPTDWVGINFVGSGGDPFSVDDRGNIYSINERQDRFAQILRIDGDGRITSLAGGPIGMADGRGSEARFGALHGAVMVCAPSEPGAPGGTLYVSDRTAIRKVMPDGTVTTLAGSAEKGNKDGAGKDARFSDVCGLARDQHGNLLVADFGNRCVRKIAPDGTVTTLPVKRPTANKPDAAEPPPIRAVGVAVGPSGDVYVLDYPATGDGERPRVCRVKPDGTATVIADLSKPAP